MKISTFSVLGALLGLATGSPTPTRDHASAVAQKSHPLGKRATVSDKADLGFATQNGGTSGGSGGTVTTVSTLAQFTAAVSKSTVPAIVFVQGIINGSSNVHILSNKTIIGLPGAGFDGVGLQFHTQSNLILRNIISSNVAAANGDGLTIQHSTNVWVDHCEFYSIKGNDKDYYDGLIDVVHASDFVTISHTYFHDHWKTSLVGHSDGNGDEDKDHLRITYANNHWKNCESRAPSLRFGTGHIYNSYFEKMSTAINTRMGAQVLVQSNVFRDVKSPIESADSKETGYAIQADNDFGDALFADRVPNGTLTATSIPYEYSLLGPAVVAEKVPGEAGAILTFEPSSNGTTTIPNFSRLTSLRAA